VFFWLLLKNRLNTRGLLRRKRIQLESYACEMCIRQREENLRHLFFRCAFAKNYWAIIGITIPPLIRTERVILHFKRTLGLPFAMDIVIIMSWCIWKERNSWLFEQEDPSIEKCRLNFKKEFNLLIHRTRKPYVNDMKTWINAL
jgi:hypothetical protein